MCLLLWLEDVETLFADEVEVDFGEYLVCIFRITDIREDLRKGLFAILFYKLTAILS